MGFEASKAKQLGRAVEQLKWLDEARTDFDFGLTIECYQRGTEAICNAMELAAKEYLRQKLPEFRASVRALMVKEIARLRAEALSEVDGLLNKEHPSYWPETRELPDDEMVSVLLGDIYERSDGTRCKVTFTQGLTVGQTKMLSPHIARVLRPVGKDDPRLDAMREALSKANAIKPELLIELGKWYERRDGAVVGPAELEYGVWCVGPKRYFANGTYRPDGAECVLDLVREVERPTPDAVGDIVDAEFEIASKTPKAEPVLEQSCCAECDSRKAQSVEELRVQSQNETDKPCADCAGTGYYHGPRLGDEACPKCKGSGLFTKSVSSTSENANENKGEVDQRPTFVDAEEDASGNPPMSDELPQPKVAIGKNHAGKTLKEVLESFRISPELASKLTEDQCDIVLPKLPEGMTWREFAAQFSDADMTFVRQVIRVEMEKELVAKLKESLEDWHPRLEPMPREQIEIRCWCGAKMDGSHACDPLDGDLTLLRDLIEDAWNLIANAGGGNWENESPEWQAAAERVRKKYHELIGSKKGSVA